MAENTPRSDSASDPSGAASTTARDGAPDPIGPSGPGASGASRVDGGATAEHRGVNFDDDEIYSGRGNGAATGGTTEASGGDSGRLGPPSEQLSTSNQPREHKG